MAMSHEPNCDRALISSLMDEALPPSQLDALLQTMDAPEARECWQVYQLIGDVLRAPDLAACGRDTELVVRLRGQWPAQAQAAVAGLPNPPAAPQPALDVRRPAANDTLFRWKLVAGLSSFATVAALSWGLWLGQGLDAGQGPQLAQQPSPPVQAVLAQTQGPAPQTEAVFGRGRPEGPVHMLRDPELDQLLAAHGQAAGVSALSAGFLRNATFEEPGR